MLPGIRWVYPPCAEDLCVNCIKLDFLKEFSWGLSMFKTSDTRFILSVLSLLGFGWCWLVFEVGVVIDCILGLLMLVLAVCILLSDWSKKLPWGYWFTFLIECWPLKYWLEFCIDSSYLADLSSNICAFAWRIYEIFSLFYFISSFLSILLCSTPWMSSSLTLFRSLLIWYFEDKKLWDIGTDRQQ